MYNDVYCHVCGCLVCQCCGCCCNSTCEMCSCPDILENRKEYKIMKKIGTDVMGMAIRTTLINLGKDVASEKNISKVIKQTFDIPMYKGINRTEFINKLVEILY